MSIVFLGHSLWQYDWKAAHERERLGVREITEVVEEKARLCSVDDQYRDLF